jgi:hypothetical protein
MIYDTSDLDIAEIRSLLTAAFTAEDLRRFCQDRPIFQPIVAEFGPAHGLNQMVDRVIDYCQTRNLFYPLLVHVWEANPRQYVRMASRLCLPDGETLRERSEIGYAGISGGKAGDAGTESQTTTIAIGSGDYVQGNKIVVGDVDGSIIVSDHTSAAAPTD